MSFAIFPKAYSVGFSSRVAPPPVQHPTTEPSVEPQPSQATPADKTDIQSIKIIPDDLEANVEGGFQEKAGIGTQSKYQVNSEPNEVVVKIFADSEEEVRQFPDPSQQELSVRIHEYQDLITEDTET